jgi:hypothetical protein
MLLNTRDKKIYGIGVGPNSFENIKLIPFP